MADTLIRGITRGRGARVVAAITTGVVLEGARRHGLIGAGTLAFGRAATAGLLLATLSKGAGERVTLQILGDGPLGSVTADADGAGAVRGFVRRGTVGIEGGVVGRARLGAAVGGGLVQVLRDLGLRDQYRGQTSITSGEIDEDVELYLTASEQIESALGCDVVLGPDGAPRVAGGVLVQCLPGGDAAAVAAARARLREAGVFAARLGGTADPAALARAVVGAAGVEVLDERPVAFRCGCARDRVAAALALLGEAELRSMLDVDGGAEVTCSFCGERYHLRGDELARVLTGLARA